MRKERILFLIPVFFILLMGISSAYLISNYDYSGGGVTSGAYYYTGLEYEDCSGGSDFVVQIEPFSCEPLLVTSDLLEEEPVTVFCKIVATQVNPFIDVNVIRRMGITGTYSSDVQSIGYFPSESALGYWNDGSLDNLALNNLGYVAITLRRNANESSMPDYVNGTLTATLTYDIENSFGIGNAQYYVPVLNDNEFQDQAKKYSFWDGRGYVRATSVDAEEATIVLYTPSFQKIGTAKLKKGETSSEFYIPSLNPCLASLKIRLNGMEYPDTRARLKINSDYVEVVEGEYFLNGKCQVKSLDKEGMNQNVKIYCKGDEKAETFTLAFSPRVNLKIDSEEKEYEIGDFLFKDGLNEKSVYLGYISSKGDSLEEEDLYAVLVARPTFESRLSNSEISSIAKQVDLAYSDVKTGASVLDIPATLGKKFFGETYSAGKWVIEGQELIVLEYGSSSTEFKGRSISIKGFSGVSEDSSLFSISEKTYPLVSSGGEDVEDLLNEYLVLDDSGEEIGLKLSYSYSSSGSPKISLENSSEKIVANFYGNSCDNHAECDEYNFSGTGLSFNNGDYNGFFDNVVSGKIDIQNQKITFRVLVSEGYEALSSEYYTKAMEDYESLINSYASQSTEVSGETYGERALYEAIMLSDELGQKKTMLELCNEFKESYPNSNKIILLNSSCEDEYKLSNSKIANYETQIDGNLKQISFEGISEPSYEEYGVEVSVKGLNGKVKNYELKKGKKVYLYGLREGSDESSNEYMELISVDEDSAEIEVVAAESKTSELFNPNRKTLKIDESNNFGSSYIFTLVDTNAERSAKVTIIPSFNYRDSESSFNFSIGIDKRQILLTPEMIDDRINALNKSMAVLNNIVDGLDKFNRGLGTACLFTGGFLTLKNLITNADGSAISRDQVMNSEGGWTERCNQYLATGTYSSSSTEPYSSLEDCFFENAKEIDSQVEEVQEILEENNNMIKSIQEANSINGVINKTAFTENYAKNISLSLGKIGAGLTDSFGKKDLIKVSEIQSLLNSKSAARSGIYDSEDLKQIQLYANLYAGSAIGSAERASYQDNLYSALYDLKKNSESFQAAEALKSESGLENSFIMDLDSEKKTIDITITKDETFGESEYAGYDFSSGSDNIESNEYVSVVTGKSSGETYLVVYSGEGNKKGVVKGTYGINDAGKLLTIYTIGTNSNPLNLYFKKIDAADLKNKYLNAELQYYESGSYKEYPAIMPLDTEEGWYVGIKDSSASSFVDSGVAAYDNSGKVRIIWLCNVGGNGLEEFSIGSNNFGDDLCQQYDLTHDVVEFSGLTLSKTNALLKEAQLAIETAQNAYRSGISSVIINGVKYKVGEPASSSSEIQCESYMSPKDCKLLFNVCDPVVCPSSRCDFGGNYPVSDVVQTGVVGSILLCAPNYKEGIYLPVCTTGIEAGLKSWVNIEESYRDCLQEYLENGEITGMCDKIHSIYACEFFWKQAIPLSKIGISKALKSVFGESTHGGSEYLTFTSSLENAKESLDYFTQYYAAESYNAFKIRSAEEAGSAVCKVSASIVYPSGSNLLESLTTPRSPAQYTGSFEETVLTTVTNPPSSHYKVYYYIYSGEDIGATFQIYLKGSSSSYYQDSASTYFVDSGYISSGDYETDTVDFSAPSGYTQLCISVNGAEECGFGKVSTSFAENYVNDLYLKEQTTKDVTKESECISGTASFYSILNPNIQSIAEDLVDSDLYAKGITRICATENPGKGTDANWNTESARWRDVGYCGDEDVRCWIDTESVKDAIKTLNIEQSALNDTADSYMKNLIESGNYISQEDYETKLNEIKDEGDYKTKINLINEIINKVFYSTQKAALYLLRGQTYGSLALDNLVIEKAIVSEGEEETGTTGITDEDKEKDALCGDGKLDEGEECDDGNTIDGDGCSSECKIDIAKEYFGKDYISPILEFEDGAWDQEACYKFYNGEWYWIYDCEALTESGFYLKDEGIYSREAVSFVKVTDSLSESEEDSTEKTIEFVKSLRGKSYLEGLKLLVERASKKEGYFDYPDIVTEKVQMSHEKVFTVDFGISTTPLFYRYFNNYWQWSFDEKDWINVDITKMNGGKYDGKTPAQENTDLMKSLIGKSLYDGIAILFDMSSDQGDFSQKETNSAYENIKDMQNLNKIYESPVFTFEDGCSSFNVCYKFFEEKWHWTTICSDTREDQWLETGILYSDTISNTATLYIDRNKEFGESLKNKNYFEGLNLLIERTDANSEKGLTCIFDTDLKVDYTDMSDERIFEVDFSGTTPIYYKYIGKEWKWAPIIYNADSLWDDAGDPIVSSGSLKGQIPAEERQVKIINLLKDRSFEEGALILFDLDLLDVFTNIFEGKEFTIQDNEYSCTTTSTCRRILGERLAEIASEVKEERDDIDYSSVVSQTGAKDFECLILQTAWIETKVQHCTKFQENDNPLYCDGNINELMDDGLKSYGILQINAIAHPDSIPSVYSFEENVRYGANLLLTNFKNYGVENKNYECGLKNSYTGWKAALRYYNGWNTDCSKGDPYYVENVVAVRENNLFKSIFPKCA